MRYLSETSEEGLILLTFQKDLFMVGLPPHVWAEHHMGRNVWWKRLFYGRGKAERKNRKDLPVPARLHHLKFPELSKITLPAGNRAFKT